MIETYKLLHDIYDSTLPKLIAPIIDGTTRGHSLKLPKARAKTSTKARSFTHRIINVWNSLPEHVVTAPSMNAFKNRLDSFWKDHPWFYDWEAATGPSTSSSMRTQ